MIIYHGQAGQYGDSIISTVVTRELKKQNPQAEVVSGLSKKYWDIVDVLRELPDVSRWIQWEGYCESFPTENDKAEIKKVDAFFHPMQGHSRPDWYKHHHQVVEAFLRHELTPPSDLQTHLPTPIVNSVFAGMVVLAPFPNNGQGVKCLTMEKAEKIVSYLKSRDIKVMQLGGLNEPQIKGAIKVYGSFHFAAQMLASAKFVITTDTVLSWLASSYSTDTLGLYGFKGYYEGVETSKNWQPINPNAIYLEADNCNNIDDKLIEEKLDYLINKTNNHIERYK